MPKTLSNDSSSAWDWGLCFRQLCPERWSSCKASQMTLGTQSWKQYYLFRSELEFRMASGRPGTYLQRPLLGTKVWGGKVVTLYIPTATVMSPGIWSFQPVSWKVPLNEDMDLLVCMLVLYNLVLTGIHYICFRVERNTCKEVVHSYMTNDGMIGSPGHDTRL